MPLVFPFILLIVALSNKVLLSEIPGRADYQDGSPCAYCWITVETEKQLIKVRTDRKGLFELNLDDSNMITGMHAHNLKGDWLVENGFLFFLLNRDNPQMKSIIKDLKNKVRTYKSFLHGTIVQKLNVKDCYLFVDRDVSLFNGFSQFRSIEVDLSKLESLKSCGEMESACIYLSPAQIVGNRSHLDQDGGVIFFDRKQRKHISLILNSIALLARSCGNLKAEVLPLETIPPSVSK